MQKNLTSKKLKELLKMLQEHNVTYYKDHGLELHVGPKGLPPVKDALDNPKKSKQQTEEEILFHSAGR